MLTLTNLTKRYGYRQVFRDVNCQVDSGQIVAVTGRNGAGKSTLLRIVAGLLRPSAGKVLLTETQIGLAAPDAPLYRELTVQENLQFFARSHDVEAASRRFIKRQDAVSTKTAHDIDLALQRFHLAPRRDDLAGDLSSGWRARLQLAVATFAAPKVLLLDEPAANLDEAGHALLWEILEEQRSHGIALVATNDAREAARCDRALVL
jgi:heme exporter protein A